MAETINELAYEVMDNLLKKKIRLQKQLIETEFQIKLVEKQITGGASLDFWFENVKGKIEAKSSDDPGDY